MSDNFFRVLTGHKKNLIRQKELLLERLTFIGSELEDIDQYANVSQAVGIGQHVLSEPRPKRLKRDDLVQAVTQILGRHADGLRVDEILEVLRREHQVVYRANSLQTYLYLLRSSGHIYVKEGKWRLSQRNPSPSEA